MKLVKPLYIWWVTVLASATAFYWASYVGITEKIWFDDVTMITSILGMMYIAALAAIGFIAYTNKKRDNEKLIDAVWFGSEQMLALGMLGTVIGFIYLLSSGITSASVTDATSLAKLLANMSVGLGIALYTNAVGILSSLITKTLLYVVIYDETQP